jgi:hypothetical protein
MLGINNAVKPLLALRPVSRCLHSGVVATRPCFANPHVVSGLLRACTFSANEHEASQSDVGVVPRCLTQIRDDDAIAAGLRSSLLRGMDEDVLHNAIQEARGPDRRGGNRNARARFQLMMLGSCSVAVVAFTKRSTNSM